MTQSDATVAVTGVGTASAINGVTTSGTDGTVKSEVEMARQRISKAAGVSPDAVKITIQFGM